MLWQMSREGFYCLQKNIQTYLSSLSSLTRGTQARVHKCSPAPSPPNRPLCIPTSFSVMQTPLLSLLLHFSGGVSHLPMSSHTISRSSSHEWLVHVCFLFNRVSDSTSREVTTQKVASKLQHWEWNPAIRF